MSNPRTAAEGLRPRGLAANVALSLATVVFVLAGLEGVCRLFDHEPPARPWPATSRCGTTEFYTVKSAATGWPPWEDYNRDGMRDREHALAGQPACGA